MNSGSDRSTAPIEPLPASELEKDAEALGRPADEATDDGKQTHRPASESDHVGELESEETVEKALPTPPPD